MAITSAGVGSGLDLESIIAATVEAENTPKLARFEKQESAVNLQLTALGQIKSDLGAFEDQVDILKEISNFEKRTATVTQPDDKGDVISVSAESTATAGSFAIDVKQLAQGSRAVQDDGNAYTATTDVVTASGGNLTFAAGTKNFTVNLSAGATLADLRTAINDASDNFGVSANIINTGTASKLVLTSSETGAGNDLTVTNDTAELDRVSTTANGGGAGGLAIAAEDAAQDAIMEIDGIAVNSSTNVFKDAIQDVTITALRASPVDPNDAAKNLTAGLDIATDKDYVKDTINKFIESFNTVVGTLTTVVASKSADSTARGIKNALINQVGTFVSGAGNLTSIYDIGIGLNKDGKLEIKSDAVNTLDDALTESYDDIGTLFAGAGGVAQTLGSTIDLYLNSGGIIKDQQDALNQQKGSIDDDREKHAYRMELFEERLREKYARLDVLIAGLRSQGSAISSSLSNLPGFTRET